jgi:putative ABC transport system permease protein
MLRAIYRILLYACPPAVRREYGREMEDGFVHCLEVERTRRTRSGRILAGMRGLIDVLIFACRARWHGWGTAREADHHTRSRRPPVILRDVRGTMRLMRSQPALTAGIVLMLALGIGATTAIFSVVYGVLLKPLPFPEPDRLVQIWGSMPSRGLATMTLTEANFWDMRDMNQSLSELGALHSASFTLMGFEMPERLTGARVSAGFFRSLGVRPVAGRIFEPGEDDPGASRTRALLSHALWTRRFGSDRGIVGRAINLDGSSYDVIGVLPPGSPWLDFAEVFVPFVRRPNADRGSWEYFAIGRLKPGVSFDAALADLQRVAKELEAKFPANKDLGATMDSSQTWIASDQLRRTLWILLWSVGLLLVIACVNVTNLLLARGSARARENAVRTALGATRADLVRERLTESLVYSLAGTALGWLIATWMLGILQAVNPGGIPRLAEVTLNGWVIAFAAAAALAVGVLTGLIPAFRTPLGNIVRALREGSRGTTGDRGQNRLRSIFVGAEVALSLVLLVGAGLLVRSLTHVLAVDRGFQTDRRMLVTVSIPASYGDARMRQTATDILERLRSVPDVISAAAVSARPLSRGSTGMGIGAADQPNLPDTQVPWATWRVVTKDYFKTIGLPLLAGRTFTDQDQIAKPWRAVISKRLADLLWPGQDPIGRTAILWKGQSQVRGEIVGVVGNMRERGLENDPTLAVYFPAGGTAGTSLQLVLYTRGEPMAAVPAIRSLVTSIDPNLPVSNVRTLEDVVDASVATRRVTMLLLVTFAGVALVLALAGVYGVLAYSVARRTSEIGVRIALGAHHGRVLRLVLAQGMRPVFVGVGVGLAATFWLSRLMASLLFEIQPHDPATYASVAAVVIGVATLACYLPARRVLTIDPAIALRTE